MLRADPIVTRILWLKGLKRENADAFGRYIYIHGTPEERNIGRRLASAVSVCPLPINRSTFRDGWLGAKVELYRVAAGKFADAGNCGRLTHPTGQ